MSNKRESGTSLLRGRSLERPSYMFSHVQYKRFHCLKNQFLFSRFKSIDKLSLNLQHLFTQGGSSSPPFNDGGAGGVSPKKFVNFSKSWNPIFQPLLMPYLSGWSFPMSQLCGVDEIDLSSASAACLWRRNMGCSIHEVDLPSLLSCTVAWWILFLRPFRRDSARFCDRIKVYTTGVFFRWPPVFSFFVAVCL